MSDRRDYYFFCRIFTSLQHEIYNFTWTVLIQHEIHIIHRNNVLLRLEVTVFLYEKKSNLFKTDILDTNYNVLFTCTIKCCQSVLGNPIYTNSLRLHLWNPSGCQLAWSSWLHFMEVVEISLHVVSSCYWELCNLRAIFIKVWWSILKM